MQATVVEPVDIREGGQLDVLGVAPRALGLDELVLVEPVEALRQAVVVAVADGPDRRPSTDLGEPFGVANRDVLRPRIGMGHEAIEGPPAGPDGLLEGVHDQVRGHGRRHPPADDHAGVDVDDERRVHEP